VPSKKPVSGEQDPLLKDALNIFNGKIVEPDEQA
jgi:hypothetical protein